MPYKYAYNPINNLLDITGKENGANGGGGYFVGVTGEISAGSGAWARIAQIQFKTGSVGSEPWNIVFSGKIFATMQNSNPYSFNENIIHKSFVLNLLIEIPDIGITTPGHSHYVQTKMALTDCINCPRIDVAMNKSAHIVTQTSNVMYFDIYAKLNGLYDKYIYNYMTNADKDPRITFVPIIGETPIALPYGSFNPDSADYNTYSQSFTNQNSIVVQHDLARYPSVTIVDDQKKQVLADVTYINENRLIVSFSENLTGTIYCN